MQIEGAFSFFLFFSPLCFVRRFSLFPRSVDVIKSIDISDLSPFPICPRGCGTSRRRTARSSSRRRAAGRAMVTASRRTGTRLSSSCASSTLPGDFETTPVARVRARERKFISRYREKKKKEKREERRRRGERFPRLFKRAPKSATICPTAA